MTILVFIIALSILVFVHEWGHFIVAKNSGVRVDIFSIGFGPKIFSYKWHGTEYRLAPIPFGGYVKIHGQDPYEEAEGDPVKAQEIANDPQSFHSKSAFKKLATVVAGPFMNIVLTFVLLPLVFMVGRLQPKILDEAPVIIDVMKDSPAQKVGFQKGDLILSIQGQETKVWSDVLTNVALHPGQTMKFVFERQGEKKEVSVTAQMGDNFKQVVGGFVGIEPFIFYGNEPVVDSVSAGSAAAVAGLQPKDRIIKIGGDNIDYWTQMTEKIQANGGKELSVTVLRDGQELKKTITPQRASDKEPWVLGITKMVDESQFIKKRFGFFESVGKGFDEGVKLFGLTLGVLKRLFTGDLPFATLGGPIQIAQATSSAAKSGFGEFIYLLAFLSLQLGVLNLLPLPVLDGGHVLFMAIEGIRRKPLSPKFRSVSTMVGFAALILLMLAVTCNDVNNLWGDTRVIQTIKSIF